jgi:hypothetical protein
MRGDLSGPEEVDKCRIGSWPCKELSQNANIAGTESLPLWLKASRMGKSGAHATLLAPRRNDMSTARIAGGEGIQE